MKALKIIGIAVLVIVLIILAVGIYMYYRMTHVKDTHDLQVFADKVCAEYIAKGNAQGMTIGIIKNGEIYVKGYGYADKELKTVPDGNTLYEIGSITKVFTATLVQQLVDKDLMAWNDNILKHLPDEAKPPFDDSTQLAHLVSHTSGFAAIPEPIFATLTNECDPYSTLTVEQWNNYLRTCKDKKKPGFKNYEYSNFGSSLLARIAEYRSGKDYETLLQEGICMPLQMGSTSLLVKDSSRFATGYDSAGNKTCHWNIPVMYGCGAIRSDVNDMLKFIQANIDSTHALNPSFRKTHEQTTDMVARGWHFDYLNGMMSGISRFLWHNGGTGGFRTYMAISPEKKTGVIVLTNQYSDEADKLGIDLFIKACITSFK